MGWRPKTLCVAYSPQGSIKVTMDSLANSGMNSSMMRCGSGQSVLSVMQMPEAGRQIIVACEACRLVAEDDGAAICGARGMACEAAQLQPKHQVVEVGGLCRRSQDATDEGTTN